MTAVERPPWHMTGTNWASALEAACAWYWVNRPRIERKAS